MSAIDDILYAPITPNPDTDIDQAVIAQITACLNDLSMTVTWTVDPSVTMATYNRIAEIIENNRFIFRAARQLCASDPHGNFRPTDALTINTLFAHFHTTPVTTEYFWTTRGAATVIVPVGICNQFSIVGGIPMVRLIDGRTYEWWMVGLMSNFAGYQGYYFFSDKMHAYNYWTIP
jgi:hypothetical protein